MNTSRLNRRAFLARSSAVAAACMAPTLVPAAPRSATDLVTLGRTGLKLSRLGMGTGSNSGNVQLGLGQEAFNKLVRYAFDRGITYFDCARGYKTLPWIGDALAQLPREKVFLLTKIGGNPENPGEVIDGLLKTYKTDYIDCLLVHCMVKDSWTGEQKRLMDAIDEAKSKKKVLSKGVSCHALPALRVAAATDWVEVNLVRVNPQAKHVDSETPKWDVSGTSIDPVMEQVRIMDRNGHGIIAMKLVGNGDFTAADDREKAVRFAMAQPEIDAVTIGFKSPAEIDEAIERMNRALA